MPELKTNEVVPSEPAAPEQTAAEPEFDWSMPDADEMAPVVEENNKSEETFAADQGEKAPEDVSAPAEPAPGIEKPAEEKPAPVEPEKPAEPPKPIEEGTKAPSEGELAAKRAAFIEEIASTYSLSPDEEVAYIEDPVKTLPKLAAKITVRVFEDTYRTIAAQLPQLLEYHLAARDTAQKTYAQAEEKFWQRWPALKGQEETVRQIGAQFRKMNPDASPEDAIEFVGMYASTKLGLQPQAPTAPAPAPVARKSAPPPPAAAGRTVGDVPAKETNIFAELSALED